MKGTRLIDITNEFNTLFSYGAYGVANNMLAKAYAHLPDMSTEKILTYVRAIQPVKDRLPVWQYFIKNTKEEFTRRGLNTDEVLKGLS